MAYMTKRRTSGGDVPIGSNLFGTCATAGSTAAKVVALSDFDVLIEGVTVHVYFANKNTADSPTLQVGSTAARPISSHGGEWESGSCVSFTYHSGIWVQNDYQESQSGTLDYTDLTNKPQINGITLDGNKSFSDLGLIDFFYPVGSYYETSDTSFNPNTAWGGTWSLEAEGMVHIGAGQNYAVGSTGGSADAVVVAHSHEVDDVAIPSSGGHSHSVSVKYRSNYNQSGSNRDSVLSTGTNTTTNIASIAANTGAHTHTVPAHSTESEGVSGTGANMPPYTAVNRWHRTA